MSNKICAIVGVGVGLGLAIAKKFGQEGYRVAMLARRLEALEEYQTSLAGIGVIAQGFSADASDSISLTNAFEQIRQTLGAPDVLVYNAAALKQKDAMSVTADEFVQDFKLNVAGALTASQQVVPGMREQGGGTILLTGGGLAFEPYPELMSLAIGKSAIRSLAFSLNKELADDNIHAATVTICGTIAPGTQFDPDQIADVYWQLHGQDKSGWERERVYQ